MRLCTLLLFLQQLFPFGDQQPLATFDIDLPENTFVAPQISPDAQYGQQCLVPWQCGGLPQCFVDEIVFSIFENFNFTIFFEKCNFTPTFIRRTSKEQKNMKIAMKHRVCGLWDTISANHS